MLRAGSPSRRHRSAAAVPGSPRVAPAARPLPPRCSGQFDRRRCACPLVRRPYHRVAGRPEAVGRAKFCHLTRHVAIRRRPPLNAATYGSLGDCLCMGNTWKWLSFGRRPLAPERKQQGPAGWPLVVCTAVRHSKTRQPRLKIWQPRSKADYGISKRNCMSSLRRVRNSGDEGCSWARRQRSSALWSAAQAAV